MQTSLCVNSQCVRAAYAHTYMSLMSTSLRIPNLFFCLNVHTMCVDDCPPCAPTAMVKTPACVLFPGEIGNVEGCVLFDKNNTS